MTARSLHWLDESTGGIIEEIAERRSLGLIELCERCETIELWIDPDPNAQLMLIWLLDYFRPHERIASKLTLVQADVRIGDQAPEELADMAAAGRQDHGTIISKPPAWPGRPIARRRRRHWFDLLVEDLSALPQLRQAVLELLEELPMRATGLGATEMRMLELISEGNARSVRCLSRP